MTIDPVGASRTNRPVQRPDTTVVQGLGIGTCLDEVANHLALSRRVPPVRSGTPICRVVQRFGSPSVTGANHGAMCNERLGESSMRGGSDNMQCRVARIDVVTNGQKEVGAGILAARSDPKRMSSEATCLIKHSPNPDVVTGGDRREQRQQRTSSNSSGPPPVFVADTDCRSGTRALRSQRHADPRHIDGTGWSLEGPHHASNGQTSRSRSE
jgi:hypothetical protein